MSEDSKPQEPGEEKSPRLRVARENATHAKSKPSKGKKSSKEKSAVVSQVPEANVPYTPTHALASGTATTGSKSAGTKSTVHKTARNTASGRRWPRVFAGSATAALAVGLVAAGTLFPGNDASAQLDPVAQALPMGDVIANCTGPTRLLSGSAAGADPEFAAASSSSKSQLSALVLSDPDGVLPGSSIDSLDNAATPLTTLATAPKETAPKETAPAASLAPATTLAPVTGVAKGKAAVVANKDVSAATALRVQPLNGIAYPAIGSVVVGATDGDLRGLAAANCQRASNDLWIAGASTTVGRTAVLILSNSSKSPATVSLELFGKNGPLVAPGGKGIVVAPGTERSVVLSGLASDQELLSVHLKSTGGPVSAVVQQSVLRGLTPGGVDFLAPVAPPALTQTIPGVRVADPAAASAISGQPGYSDAATALEVTVPGIRDVVVEVKAYGASGQVALPNGGVFTAGAGKVTELALAGLPQGSYTLTLNADSAVAATVRLMNSTKPGDAVDLAYAPATQRLGVNHLVTLPGGVSSNFVFTAPTGAASLTLTPVSSSGVLGPQKTVDLKAAMTSVIDPSALLGDGVAGVLISASGAPVFGTQLLGVKDSADIAVLPIVGSSADSQSLAITVKN